MEPSISSPSSSSPPPSSASVSKSLTIYPVPDPAVQAGFSSVSLHSAGHKDEKQGDSSHPSLFSVSERTDQMSLCPADSPACNNNTSAGLTSNGFEEISSPLSDKICKTVVHKEKFERINDTSEKKPGNELEKVHRTAQGIFDHKKLSKDDHMKVTVPLCSSTDFHKIC